MTAGGTTTTFTERLVGRLARTGRSTSDGRRGFLVKTAMAGTALAVAPWKYITRPASAYATVCGPGAACSDGWSAFCCTINGGRNSCPAETFIGGWWKADQSGFCCGNARYYTDCNAYVHSSWKCHCATGTCDNRRVACNQFRYGQCNQQIGPYGPVVCRVVSCTPPWETHNCTSTSATDNATVAHSAPCLPGNCPSAIETYYYSLRGPQGPLGSPIAPERVDAFGGHYRRYRHGMIVWSKQTGAHAVLDPITSEYIRLGGSTSTLKYPNADTVSISGGKWSGFQGGLILWSSGRGAHAVTGGYLEAYRRVGSYKGPLGIPTTGVVIIGRGRRQGFQHGAIYWSKGTGTHSIYGPIRDKYNSLGTATGFLGFPATDVLANPGGKYVRFAHGDIVYSSRTGAWSLHGPILDKYRSIGSSSGKLGFPTSDVYKAPPGYRANFQHGQIWLNAANGDIAVVMY